MAGLIVSEAYAKGKAAGAGKGRGRGAGAAAKIPKISAARLLRYQDGHDIELALIKQLVPVVVGCNVTKDETFHCRWKICYPTGMAPRMSTRAWGPAVNQWSAALHCVRWAWEAHFFKTGQVCPVDMAAW